MNQFQTFPRRPHTGKTNDEAKSLFINFGGADSQTGVQGQLSAIFERMVHDDGCIDEENSLGVLVKR